MKKIYKKIKKLLTNGIKSCMIPNVSRKHGMREWLSWWSATLPRSRPRVRVPSRALEKRRISRKTGSSFFDPEGVRTHAWNPHGFEVSASLRSVQSRGSTFHFGRCWANVPRTFSTPGRRAPCLAQSLCVYKSVPSCTHLTTNLTTERLQRFANQFVGIFLQRIDGEGVFAKGWTLIVF